MSLQKPLLDLSTLQLYTGDIYWIVTDRLSDRLQIISQGPIILTDQRLIILLAVAMAAKLRT